jgi:hypothetical protein
MAAADLKLSRRALLGAAFGAPLLPAAPEEARDRSRGVARWQRALGRFRRAAAELAALEGGPDEEAFGEAHDRFNAALRRLLAAPAPDVTALAVKLDCAVAAELADLAFAPPALAALARDARRLAL